MSDQQFTVIPVIAGSVTATALALDEPLSLWGGFDAETGLVIDQQHPQCGEQLSGCVVFMPSGRGSSSASSVLAEAARLGTAPAAFVLAEPDEIVALGALVAAQLYDVALPIAVGPSELFRSISAGDHVELVGDRLGLSRRG